VKIFKTMSKGPILSKSDIFTGKVHEHFEPIEGKEHASQGYIRGVIEGNNSALQLTKYHLIKKFKNNIKDRKELTAYNQQKTTKYIRKMSQIYYFTILTKKIFYLTATLKKIKKNIKIWIKQLIQNEIYYLKKALELTKTKEQIAQIYLKFKTHTKIYKHLHLKYIKATYIQYLKILKKHKRYWSKMLITGFTNKKYYKKRARILPFIMFLKKRLFKKLRTGTHKNIRYWKKLIKKFAKRYNILQEQDVTHLTYENYPINKKAFEEHELLNTTKTISIKPYILLRYIIQMRTKNRTELFNKIRKLYYAILINQKTRAYNNTNIKKTKLNILKQKKALLSWKKLKVQKLSKLSRFCAIVMKKKKYIYNKSYLSRRGASNISRMIAIKENIHQLKQYKEDIISKTMLQGKISIWFVLFKHWNRMLYIKLLKQIIKKSDIYRRYKKKKKIYILKNTPNKIKKLVKLYAIKNKKNKQTKVMLLLRNKIRRLLRKLYEKVPTILRKKIINSILNKLMHSKIEIKNKRIKKKLIRVLIRKKKGITRKHKRRRFKNKKFKFINFKKRKKYRKKRKKKKFKNKKRQGTKRVIKKAKKQRRHLKWKTKRKIRKFIKKGGRKYKNTAFLMQDYSCHWIDNLRKKSKFKKKKNKKTIMEVTTKIKTWKMRRFLKKNHSENTNTKFYIVIRQKEITQLAANLFIPENV